MRELVFSIGSFIVAVGAVFLSVAVATNLFVGRALTSTETLFAALGALAVGFVWWRVMHRKLKHQSFEASE